jgi:N-methylhydantoinase A
MVEMHTIGAGGGSIAWLDEGGGLRIGPQSAGSYPGPACYGNNDEPTVTDANLIMGYLNAKNFLGGEMDISTDKSINAIDKKIASELGLKPVEAAVGIRNLVDANMCGGINVVSTQKGYDLREFSLMAFGGGGSLHAAALADELNLKSVIIPLSPGNFSAIGCQLAKIRYDYVRTIVANVSTLSVEDYNTCFAEMKEDALRDLAAEGFEEKDLIFTATSDMRYSGQAWELSIPVPSEIKSRKELEKSCKDYEAVHKRIYGYILEDDISFVNMRFAAFAIVPSLEFARFGLGGKDVKPEALKGTRNLLFDNKYVEGKIYSRELMHPGAEIQGPAIIEEYAASTVVPPGHTAAVDSFRNIIITKNR